MKCNNNTTTRPPPKQNNENVLDPLWIPDTCMLGLLWKEGSFSYYVHTCAYMHAVSLSWLCCFTSKCMNILDLIELFQR